MEEQLQFKNTNKELLDARLHPPENKTTKAAILLHGFAGNKDLAWLHKIGHKLAEQGIATLRFDLSGHGDSEGLFKDLGTKKGMSDLNVALEVMKERGYQEFALLGHSLGGAITLLSIPNHLEVKTAVVVAAPVAWQREENEVFIRQTYNKHGLETGQLLDDVLSEDISGAVQDIEIPILAIHGTKDEVIPFSDSELLVDSTKGEAKLELIEGGDHILIPDMEKVIQLSVDWITDKLGG